MMRLAGASLLLATVVSTGACGVGGGDDDDNGLAGPVQGGIDNNNDKLMISCNASFKVNGTFTPGTPARPTDADTGQPIGGCWPVGTWTFTATVAQNGCSSAPELLPSYSFKVDRIEGSDMQGLVDSYTVLSNTSTKKVHLSVSSTGQGCEANFELGSTDGKDYWNFKPLIPNPLNAGDPPSTTIEGAGDFDRFTNNGWPWQ